MSLIPMDELQTLNQDVKEKGYVDREHLMKFLTLIPTNEAPVIIQEVKDWLQFLHNSSDYSSIVFPTGDIEAVIGDLDSYGRVQPLTIQQFKQNSNKVISQV
jgi:hypothetical protein